MPCAHGEQVDVVVDRLDRFVALGELEDLLEGALELAYEPWAVFADHGEFAW